MSSKSRFRHRNAWYRASVNRSLAAERGCHNCLQFKACKRPSRKGNHKGCFVPIPPEKKAEEELYSTIGGFVFAIILVILYLLLKY